MQFDLRFNAITISWAYLVIPREEKISEKFSQTIP
jgi:hypothetical protein